MEEWVFQEGTQGREGWVEPVQVEPVDWTVDGVGRVDVWGGRASRICGAMIGEGSGEGRL